jgi:hypothetical protein
MALPKNFPTRYAKGSPKDEHSTTYQSSRGGWYPEEKKPVPGEKKKQS